MKSFVMAVGALAFAAGSSHAALFSFASDRNSDGPTFSGIAPGVITDGRPDDTSGGVTVMFLIDRDNDGPGVAQAISSRFEYNAVVTGYQVTPFGAAFIHSFTLDGTMSIVDAATNDVIVAINFDNALMSSWSNSASSLGRSAQMQDNVDTDPGLSFSTFGAAADLAFEQLTDIGFSLTNVRLENGNRVPVIGGQPGTPWLAEASFSGSSVIPAPGALALASMAAVVITRRRRN